MLLCCARRRRRRRQLLLAGRLASLLPLLPALKELVKQFKMIASELCRLHAETHTHCMSLRALVC